MAEKTVDGVTEGEVRCETVPKGPFHQQDDGIASFRSRGTLPTHLSGVGRAIRLGFIGSETVRMARPLHNSRVKLSDMFSTVAALLFGEEDPEERHRLLRDYDG